MKFKMQPIEFFSNIQKIDAERKKEGIIKVERGEGDISLDDYYYMCYDGDTEKHYPCVVCHDVFKVDKPIRIVKDKKGDYHALLNTRSGKYIHCSYAQESSDEYNMFTFVSPAGIPCRGYHNNPSGFTKKEFIEYVEKLNSRKKITSDELNDVFLNACVLDFNVEFADNKIKLPKKKIKDHEVILGKDLNETKISSIIRRLSASAKIFIKFALNERHPNIEFLWAKVRDRYRGYMVNPSSKELGRVGLCYDWHIPVEVKSIMRKYSDAFEGFEGCDGLFYLRYGNELSKRKVIEYASLTNPGENTGEALEHDIKSYLNYIVGHTIRTSWRYNTMPISHIRKINDSFKIKEDLAGIKTEDKTRRFFFIDYFSRKLGLVDDFNDKLTVKNQDFAADDFFDAWLNDMVYNELFFIPEIYIEENFGYRDKDKKADPFMFLSKRRKSVIDVVNELNHKWISVEEFFKKLCKNKGFFIREEMGWEVYDLEEKKWLIDKYEWDKVEGKYALIVLEIMNYFGLVLSEYKNNNLNIKKNKNKI
ncbi:MAG: hypothetical protein A7316_04840 [Candidatus Altiarchaeales archaeon WOR_SM1_86-2]|nr:MAG: hypothetical protein A7315_04705 [Candidatus Altiarchaeales archaeon WOR_SM1_79]ODS39683.1 MAG: hypothetical protein A7316_04840 [Candidatus Altiarchaeales archaeon WOR_SM1_86-2]